jgi:peptide/nickel transport system substrate-binding protein
MRRVEIAVMASVVALGLLAAGCGSKTDTGSAPSGPTSTVSQNINETISNDQPASGGQLVYGVPAETSSFNPAIGSWASYSLTIARSIFDTLGSYDESGTVQPLVAEKFDHSDDYRTWTVTLRPGLKYSNGKPVTAQSVVEAQRAFKASPILSETYRTDDWEVKDDLTFVMKASQVWTTFPHAMTTQIGTVVDPAWLTSTDITHPVGVGAFTVDHWDVEKEMVLKKNPNYWRKDSRGIAYPYLDGITFRIIVDEAARADALRKGEIDVMMQTYSTPSVGEMLNEAKSGKFQAFSDKGFETPEDYVLVNTAKAPLNDVDARKALAYAIDQADYIAKITGGLDEPANSPWAPSSKWYTDTDYPKYDVAESKRLVEAVKAKNGGKFTVSLLGNPSNESVRVQQYLQDKWKAVGIDVTLEAQLQSRKIIKMIQGDYDLALTQQFDNVHPYNELIYWQDWHKPLGTLSLNFSRLSDPQLTQLAIDAAGSSGADEKAKYNAISKRMAEIVPFVWLAHAARTLIAKPRVVNLVKATLPDGKPMISFIQGSHATFQIWLRR